MMKTQVMFLFLAGAVAMITAMPTDDGTKELVLSNPCSPSPCGPNSQCRELQQQAVCSCLPTYVGSPPDCKPECVANSECPANLSCINQRCIDSCPGSCGLNALCAVYKHTPMCSCPPDMTGDPFTRCVAF